LIAPESVLSVSLEGDAENLKVLLKRYDTNIYEKWSRSGQLKFTIHEGSLGLMQDLQAL
jgi:hypothetical protein